MSPQPLQKLSLIGKIAICFACLNLGMNFGLWLYGSSNLLVGSSLHSREDLMFYMLYVVFWYVIIRIVYYLDRN